MLFWRTLESLLCQHAFVRFTKLTNNIWCFELKLQLHGVLAQGNAAMPLSVCRGGSLSPTFQPGSFWSLYIPCLIWSKWGHIPCLIWFLYICFDPNENCLIWFNLRVSLQWPGLRKICRRGPMYLGPCQSKSFSICWNARCYMTSRLVIKPLTPTLLRSFQFVPDTEIS